MSTEPDWKRDLRWLALRHRTIDRLARDLPFDTTGETLRGLLSQAETVKIGEDRKRLIRKHKERVATTGQRVRYGMKVLSEACEVMQQGGRVTEERIGRVQDVVDKEMHKLCETLD